jgi:RND family efflux transporter MFP subunit
MNQVFSLLQGARVSVLQSSKPADPLAALRINRNPSRPPRSRWRGVLMALVFLGGLAAAGAWAWQEYGEEFTRLEVKTGTVELRSPDVANSVLAAQGYLKSEKQAAIGAKSPGRVLKVYVREGQPVEKDVVLAELEHADVDQTLQAMKASAEAMAASVEAMSLALEKSKAELAEVESTTAQDERDFLRVEKLYQARQISLSEYEQADAKRKGSRSRRDSMVAAVALAEAREKEAEAQLRQAEARYREAEQQRENLFVRAPFKGIVISKEAEEGESIMPGGMGAASGRGSVVTLADLLHLEVETDVKEDYVSRVRKGQDVSVAVDAVPDRRFGGKVRTIIPMGDRAKGTVKVKVQLNVDEVKTVNDPATETFTLFPEMAATVHFLREDPGAERTDAAPKVYAPRSAVESDGGGSFVWRVVEGAVRRVSVTAGDAEGSRIVIEQGLKGGEAVVVDPPRDLEDGLRVRVRP